VTSQPIGARAAAFGLPTAEVDGNDVLAVYDAASAAIARARTGAGPSFIEARTHRLTGHHEGDVGFSRRYRTKEEFEEQKRQEPIGRFRDWLLANQMFSAVELEEIEAGVERQMQEALEFLNQSPAPDVAELWEHVYA
jgi:TPP-dependent pyruvate/acetoin dehydrogenase alpha subunit